MLRPLTSSVRRRVRRRGALLIAVIGLLTLFAIFALFFVFYADAEATNARLAREKETIGGEAPPPNDFGTTAFNYVLGSIAFDESDVGNYLNSLRGHSLARTEYGWQGTPSAGMPFSGYGTFHDPSCPVPGVMGINDRAFWVNGAAPFPSGAGALWIDREWTTYRNSGQLGTLPMSIPGNTYIPAHAPYTYPDLNNFILASLSPATGEVLVKSLHRDWLFNTGSPNPLAPWNPATMPMNTDWVTPEGRTRCLRPRPVDQLTAGDFSAAGLPYPIAPGLSNYNGAQQGQLYALIQAKIKSGEIIPYPPQNADGSYTGDIQNLLGGVGTQKNDSILIDMGMAPRYWNGKWIKPLASILLTDLDGYLNLNAHGNIRASGAHASYAGYGPSEVNLGQLLNPGDAANLLNARGASALASRSGVSTLNYDRSGSRIPLYSQVNWDGAGTASPIQLPSYGTGNPLQTSPNFANTGAPTFWGDNVFDGAPVDTYNKTLNHPLLWNPNDWPSGLPAGALSRTFPLSDLKRFNLRYAADTDWYLQTDQAMKASGAVPLAGNSLVYTGFPGPQTLSGNSYRLDPAHAARMLTTSLSSNWDLPGLTGNFNTSVGPGGVPTLPPAALIPPVPATTGLHPTNTAFTGIFQGGAGADFTSTTNFRNPNAVLGPIDLNRQLTDYRTMTTLPLNGANSGNSPQAWADRHNLARDIFARLIVVSGFANASVNVNGDVVINPAALPPELNAMRYLAQLAANMVDTIDNDDVSTAFAWNPGPTWTTPNTLTTVSAGNIAALFSLASTTVPAPFTTPPTGVVYGVEKPRLVINEAYGELTNGDEALTGVIPPALPARVRFYVELMNPTTTPYGAGATATSPLGDGSVALFDVASGINPYRLIITREGGPTNSAGTVLSNMRNPTNSLGYPLPGVVADITNTFGPVPANQRTVSPANGAWNYAATGSGTQGFILVGAQQWTNPHLDGAGNAIEFNPNTGAAPYNQMIVGTGAGTGTAMEYAYPGGTQPATASLQTDALTNPIIAYGLRRHVVALQRLANPYVAAGPTNPYITVDWMDWVPAYDAVARGSGDTTTRPAKGAANITNAGYESMQLRASIGKVQPYAGYANSVITTNTPVNQRGYNAGGNTFPLVNGFPYSMVIYQNPNPVLVVGSSVPRNTFFRQNGRNIAAPGAPTYALGPPVTLTDTIMAPFDWLVHYDRPIANSLELMSLQATKPHQVSQYTIRMDPTTAGPTAALVRNWGLAPWFGMLAAPHPRAGQPAGPSGSGTNAWNFNTTTNLSMNGLYRALDLLRVKPWTFGMPLGGKVQGKININTVQDLRVLSALMDPQPGNLFNAADVTQAYAGIPGTTPGLITNNPGSAMLGSRTPTSSPRNLANGTTVVTVPVPGPTIDDWPNPVSGVGPIGGAPLDRPIRALGVGEWTQDGSGSTATLGRYGSGLQDTILRINPTTGAPLLMTSNLAGQAHPYLQMELARKIHNNTATTSNAFAVAVTIVFHEVRLNGTNPIGLDDRTVPPTASATLPVTPGIRYALGKEAYKEIPGDLRQQFFAVIDRSNLVFSATTGGLQSGYPWMVGNTPLPANAYPFSTAMKSLTPAGGGTYNLYLWNTMLSGPANSIVYSDGRPLQLTAGMPLKLVIGVGANQETVVFNSVNPDGSWNVTAPSKIHAAGEMVSNFYTGNPGPLSTLMVPNPANSLPVGSPTAQFDPIRTPNGPYRGVVPYATRVR